MARMIRANSATKSNWAPLGIPARIPGYPSNNLAFPGLRGTYRTFWPLPLHVEDPTPLEDIRSKKLEFVFLCSFFLSDCGLDLRLSHTQLALRCMDGLFDRIKNRCLICPRTSAFGYTVRTRGTLSVGHNPTIL